MDILCMAYFDVINTLGLMDILCIPYFDVINTLRVNGYSVYTVFWRD